MPSMPHLPAPPDPDTAEHPDVERYRGFMKNQLTRQSDPLKAIDLSEINGEPAAASDHAPLFRRLFQATREGASLRLRRRYVLTEPAEWAD